MPLFSRCPKCQQPVTVPDGIPLRSAVRCPLCSASYPLGEAVSALPPSLIPVDAAELPGAADPSDREPTTAASLGSPSSAQSGLATADRPGQQTPILDVGKQVDGAVEIDSGMPGSSSAAPGADRDRVDAQALSGLQVRESEDQAAAGAGSHTRRRRPRREEKGPVRVLVEVACGGLVGLTIGYYIACWVGLDMPRLPLPLLPHTTHWLESPSQQPEENEAPPPGSQAQPPAAPNVPTESKSPLAGG